MRKESPLAHVCVTVTVVVPDFTGAQEVPATFATVMFPVANGVHPAGTGPRVTVEPEGNTWPAGEVNVKVRVPVEDATTLVGKTVIVPEPLAAVTYETVTAGCGEMLARVPLDPLFVWVVKVAVPAVDGAVTDE
jgi:hypothetical protein